MDEEAVILFLVVAELFAILLGLITCIVMGIEDGTYIWLFGNVEVAVFLFIACTLNKYWSLELW